MTDADFAALMDRVKKLEEAVGDSSVHIDATSPRPAELPNGRLNLMYSDYQLHVAEDTLNGTIIPEIKGRLDALENAPAPVYTPVDVFGELATRGVYVQQNRLGVGIAPDPDSDAAVTVGGESAAVIDGISNTKGTDGQNPNEVHKGSVVVMNNDGEIQLRQYELWRGGVMTRNTTNRPATRLSIDSQGDICVTDSRAPKGQIFYIIKDFVKKMVRLDAFQLGWKVEVQGTSEGGTYAAPDIEELS